MSAIAEVHFDTNTSPGVLQPTFRPGVEGWYWCIRKSFAAPEVVYVTSPIVSGEKRGKVMTTHGNYFFFGSEYDADDVKWFGPIHPPQAKGFF